MSSIAVLTATRAEYGLLRPVIARLVSKGVDTRILVTGMHLSPAFGMTVSEIIDDDFDIDVKIPILLDSDSSAGISKTMALALAGFADYFEQRQPDALLVLGDRYETLAVCCAALNARIPIFHLYGGETTEGAIDEAIRHSITKMSYLHFTSTESYRKRVIQLGESPNRVFNVGAVGIENALNLDLLNHEQLEKSFSTQIPQPYAVMTYHPVTLDNSDPVNKLKEVLKAIATHPEITFIATKANADAGGRAINEALEDFARHNNNFMLFESLGSLRYLSALSNAAFVLGNSSSGLLEAPAFCIPAINVGDRQRGRVFPESVINCEENVEAINKAITQAMDSEFRSQLQNMKNPYGRGDSSRQIVDVIVDTLRHPIDLKKKFYDVDFSLEGNRQ